MSSKDIVVDEDLPNFFEAVRLQQADEVILESENLKINYGFEIEDPKILHTLDMVSVPKKSI